MIQKLGGKAINMFSDSRLVIGQVNGELDARDEIMQGYLSQVKRLQSHFDSFNLLHIPKSGNTHADSLATLATSSAQSLPRVIFIEDLCKPSVTQREVIQVHQVRVGTSWMDPLVLFLKDDILPENKAEVDKIQRKTSQIQLSEDQKLYKHSFSRPYLFCVHPKASKLILEELHEGIYGSHTGARSLSYRAITQGCQWLNMQKEAHEYEKKYDQCQRFALNIHQQGRNLNPLTNPWPFAQWGLDIVRPFPRQQGTRGIYWSASTILLNGLKLNFQQTSEMWTPRSFFGRTLLPGLGSRTLSSQTMVFNLIVRPSGDTAANWEL